MDQLCKTTGVVLKRINFDEADQILTVLTRDFGKISILAKGARRMKSKFCGRLELFYEINLVFFRGRTLHYLNEAEVILTPEIENFDLKTKSVLFYMAEATNKLLPEGQEASTSFDLLIEALRGLNGEEVISEVILYAYLVKLLSHLGFMGSFEECARSNVKLNLNEPLYLSAKDASLVRSGYAESTDMRLTPSVIKWVNYMQKEDFSLLKRVRPSHGEKSEVFYILQSLFSNILGVPLKSEAFLVQTSY